MDPAVLLAALLAPGDAAPPPRDPRCPEDARLVVGKHHDEVEHLCVDWRKNEQRCFAYYPHMTVAHGPVTDVAVCMDRYEAPNEKGKRPIVMKSFSEAKAWCEGKKKRICTEAEWETACEQGDFRPWQYGWKVDKKACNSDKHWKEFDGKALMAGGDTAAKEVERLWQGTPSGAKDQCETQDGIFDMMGNVEEWVASSRKYHKHAGVLMGGFWAKPWTGCRGTNDAHEPSFVFYEVGFRCCTDPKEPP